MHAQHIDCKDYSFCNLVFIDHITSQNIWNQGWNTWNNITWKKKTLLHYLFACLFLDKCVVHIYSIKTCLSKCLQPRILNCVGYMLKRIWKGTKWAWYWQSLSVQSAVGNHCIQEYLLPTMWIRCELYKGWTSFF